MCRLRLSWAVVLGGWGDWDRDSVASVSRELRGAVPEPAAEVVAEVAAAV